VEEMQKFSVKPGITGLAQINGRGLLSWGETLKWDLEYVRTRSVLLDLKILFLTFWYVAIRRGAL
jgi:lipopolysaccharide/colanic/teichoic acid biosynthesis glycosyltransferase